MKKYAKLILILLIFMSCYSERSVCEEKKGLETYAFGCLLFSSLAGIYPNDQDRQTAAIIMCAAETSVREKCNKKSNIGFPVPDNRDR